MAQYKLGRIKPVYQGVWQANNTYVVDDIVTVGGKTYICVISNTSSSNFSTDLNSNPSLWNLIADGSQWRGSWLNGTSYNLGDLALYGGIIYQCATPHTSTSSTAILTATSFNVASGTATLGFAQLAVQPFLVGSTITLAGFSPTSTSGTVNTVNTNFTVLTCSTTQLTFALTGTYTASSLGTVSGVSQLGLESSQYNTISVSAISAYGVFTCSQTSLTVGEAVVITGTSSSGSIVGYSSPSTYYIVATNGLGTQFTLSATQGGSPITTVAGTGSGLSFNIEYWIPYSSNINWAGAWTTNTRYKLNDLVSYGGYSYICNTPHVSASTATLGLEANQSSWSTFNAGIFYQGNWTTLGNGTRYRVNDVVTYGSDLWICTSAHTASTTFSGSANWSLFVAGFEYENSWISGSTYAQGDVVSYGGNTYVALQNNSGHIPSTATSYWQPFTTGLTFCGAWSSNPSNLQSGQTGYRIGDVVTVDGYTYLALADNSIQTLTATGTTNSVATMPSTTISTTGALTISGSVTGTVAIGMYLSGGGLTANTYYITSGSGTSWQTNYSGTAISSSTITGTLNTVTISSTANLVAGLPVSFATSLNNISSSSTYYVLSILNATTFTVSTQQTNGYPVTVITTTPTATMPSSTIGTTGILTIGGSVTGTVSVGMSLTGSGITGTYYIVSGSGTTWQTTYTGTAIASTTITGTLSVTVTTNPKPPFSTYWGQLNSGIKWNPSYANYTGLSATNISSIGSGATFSVLAKNTTYVVTITAGGSNYIVGDTMKILGTSLGGLSPANDLTITVASITGGAIATVTNVGISVTWSTSSSYVLGDTVLWGVSTYICVLAHTSASGNRPDADLTGTYWNLMASGTEQAVLTTQGDMFYYGANGPTRLPIGTDGQILRVNNTSPAWQYYGQINNLVYVAPTGVDTTGNGQGTTIDKPWQSVRYACQQVEDGYLNPNSKFLLTANKEFMMKEINNYTYYQYTFNVTGTANTTITVGGSSSIAQTTTANLYSGMPIVFTTSSGNIVAGTIYYVATVPTSTTFTIATSYAYATASVPTLFAVGTGTANLGTYSYNQSKTERDAGLVIQGLIFDICRNGTYQTTTNVQAYFVSNGTTFTSGVNAYDVPAFNTALNYLSNTLIPSVLGNSAPTTNYQSVLSPALATASASGTGTVATITYTGAAFTVGSFITVSGVTPTAYNGTWQVTASSSGSVSFNSTATGSQTVAGTVQTEKAIQQINTNYTVESGVQSKAQTLISYYTTCLSAGTTNNVLPAVINPATTISIKTGTYNEILPINVPSYTALMGDELRSTIVQPYAADPTLATVVPKAQVALNRIRTLIPNLMSNTAITPTSGNTVTQVRTLPNASTGSTTAIANLQTSFNIIYELVASGLGSTPVIIMPQPTGFSAGSITSTAYATTTGSNSSGSTSGYANAYIQIQNNYNFLITETLQYLITNPGTSGFTATSYGQYELGVRDLTFILDSMLYDLTYGGNTQSLIAGAAYYSLNILQITAAQQSPYVAALTRIKNVISLVAQGLSVAVNGGVTSGNNVVQQTSGTGGSPAAGGFLQDRLTNIINYINSGTPDTTVSPYIGAQSIDLQTAYNAVSASISNIASDAQGWVYKYFQSVVYTNPNLILRDATLIATYTAYDMVYGSNFNAIQIARAFNRANTSATNLRSSSSSELAPTLGAINFMYYKMKQIAASGAVAQIQTTIDDIVNYLQGGPAAPPQITWPQPALPALPTTGTTYTNVSGTNITGTGSSAVFTINRTTNGNGYYNYFVNPTTAGTGYSVGNTIKILGTSIGGLTPVNDIVLNIKQVNSGGIVIVTYSDTNSAAALFEANRAFLIAESVQYFTNNYSSLTTNPNYSLAKNQRDMGYILDAVHYDLIYGGNWASQNAGMSYYSALYGTQISSGFTSAFSATVAYVSTLAQTLVVGSTVASPLQSAVSQVQPQASGLVGASTHATTISNLFTYVTNFVTNGLTSGAPTATITTIAGTTTTTFTTASAHGLVVGDMIIPQSSSNGLVSTIIGSTVTPYYVVSIPSTTQFTLASSYNGTALGSGTFTAGTSLSIVVQTINMPQLNTASSTASVAWSAVSASVPTYQTGSTAAFTATLNGTSTINVTAVSSGTISLGMSITGTGIAGGTTITAFVTGSGGTGTYTVSLTTTSGTVATPVTGVSISAVSQSSVVGYINTTYPAFSYLPSYVQRDIFNVTLAMFLDTLLGSNYATVQAGRAYNRTQDYKVQGYELTVTTAALNYLQTLVATTLSSSTYISQLTTATTSLSTIVSYLNSTQYVQPQVNGTISYNNTLGIIKGAEILRANIAFLTAEVSAYYAVNYNYSISNVATSGNVITTSSAHALVINDPVQFNPSTVTTTATAYSGANITVGSTTGIVVNGTVVFGSSFGAVSAGVTYYVLTASGTTITVSAVTTGGAAYSVGTSGTMSSSVTYTGFVNGGLTVGTTYYVASVPSTTTFTVTTSEGYTNVNTGATSSPVQLSNISTPAMNVVYYAPSAATQSDISYYLNAIIYDLQYTGNYRSLRYAQVLLNSVNGSAKSNFYLVRNASGIRNMTMNGLTGYLSTVNNSFGTRRPTGGAYTSLDPGFGPNDSNAWIYSRSCYVQNCTMFGYAAIGAKVDGALHAGGYHSMVANDYTCIIGDGIGWQTTGAGSLSELVSVFNYYSYAGYMAELGGRIRATNGNSSYGVYGVIAEGVDTTEVPLYGTLNNRANQAQITSVVTDSTTQILRFEFENAGSNYSSAVPSISGSGYNASAFQDEFRDAAVFETRLIDLNNGNGVGGSSYVTATNTSQGGTIGNIVIAATDTTLSNAYNGDRIQLLAGTGVGQYANIIAYSNGSKTATIVRDSITPFNVTATTNATATLSSSSINSSGVLTVGTVTGTIAIGMFLTGGSIAAGTYIVSNISGSGAGSTWQTNITAIQSSTTITGTQNTLTATSTANMYNGMPIYLYTAIGGLSTASNQLYYAQGVTATNFSVSTSSNYPTSGSIATVTTTAVSTVTVTQLAILNNLITATNSLSAGQTITFNTSSNGIDSGSVYYVSATNLSSSAFTVGTTPFSGTGITINGNATGLSITGTIGTAVYAAGWDHVIPGSTTTNTLDLTTGYIIEPHIVYSGPGYIATARSLVGIATWGSVAYGNGQFVAIPTTGTTTTYSANGKTWSNGGALSSSQSWSNLVYGGGQGASATAVVGGFGGAGAVLTAVVGTGTSATQIIGVNIVNGGYNYTTPPTIVFVSSNGAGSGATAVCTVLNGAITSVTMNINGSGYTATPTVRAVTSIVSSVTVNAWGKNYFSAPTITFATPQGLNPTTYPLSATLVTGTYYQVPSSGRIYYCVSGGSSGSSYPNFDYTTSSGYTSISYSGSTLTYIATTATATPTYSNGGVTAITVTNPGYGYTTVPSVTIIDSSAAFIAMSTTSSGGTYFSYNTSTTLGSAWTALGAGVGNPYISTLNLYGLAYGNGIYVAVGGASGTATAVSSSAPLTASGWISRTITALSAGYYSAVAYGAGGATGGSFIAINNGGNITSISNNGSSWTAGGTLPSSTTWTSIAYGNNKFVALSTAGAIAYSIDYGTTWKASPTATGTVTGILNNSYTWTKISYGEGLFFAVASGTNTCATSPDGIVWTINALSSSSNWSSVAFGNPSNQSSSVIGAQPVWVSVSSTSGTTACSIRTGATPLGRMKVASNTVIEIRLIEPGSGFPKGNVTATTTGTNLITVDDTINLSTSLANNQPIEFNTVSAGGLTTNTTYYVIGSSVTSTQLQVTATIGGTTPVTLSTSAPTGMTYTAGPVTTQIDPNHVTTAPIRVRTGDGALANPSFTNRGLNNATATASILGDGYGDLYQNSSYINVSNIYSIPTAGANVQFSTITGSAQWYKLVQATNILGIPGNYTATFQINPSLSTLLAPPNGTLITTRLKYSQVRLTGHDFLYIGTGNQTQTNYPNVIPGNAIQANQTYSTGGGRVFFTSTDQDGNFNVGNLFGVQQSTGTATLNASAFALSGLQSLTLGNLSVGAGSATITNFSTDPYFTANSDNVVPTQKAIKSYITAQIGGGSSSLNVNTITSGQIYIANNTISNTSGNQILITSKMTFTGGIDGAPVALAFFGQK